MGPDDYVLIGVSPPYQSFMETNKYRYFGDFVDYQYKSESTELMKTEKKMVSLGKIKRKDRNKYLPSGKSNPNYMK